MNDLKASLAMASSGMRANAARLRHTAENIANADTPGYRRKTIEFRESLADGDAAVTTGPVRLDRSQLEKIHDPSHPLADESGYYEGSNVEMIIEIADSREAQRGYDANLKMFDQARQMSIAVLELLRK
jgi:flagellar basal-body rod protein FlgC